MKNTWRHYATKARFEQKGYFRKHRDGGAGREASQASRSNRLLESRKEQEEIEGLIIPTIPECFKEIIDEEIQYYGKIVQLRDEEIIFVGEESESIREEVPIEAYQEGRQGICEANQGYEGSDQGRCEVEEIINEGEKMKKAIASKKPSTKTSTATKTATATKTSTDAYTQGNITVTGGAGKGATSVKIGLPGGSLANNAKKPTKTKGKK